MAVERFHHFDGALLSVLFVLHETGDTVPTHTHLAPHTIYVLRGSAEVGLGGASQFMSARSCDTVPAGMSHWLRALEPMTEVFCALIPRAEDGSVLTPEQLADMTPHAIWQAQTRV